MISEDEIEFDHTEDLDPEDGDSTPGYISSIPLGDLGSIVLFGEINYTTCKQVFCKLERLEKVECQNEIDIHICSEGGDLHAGFALIDKILSSPLTINTYLHGAGMSMGFMIFLAGDYRYIGKHSIAMSHHFSSGNIGNYHELKSDAKSFDMIHDIVLNYLNSRIKKMTKAKIEKTLIGTTDKYLSPNDCLELGIAHEIF